jgi:hypothetical protein
MYTFKRSDWAIAGNSGVTGTVGTPTLKIQVGLSYLKLPVRENGEKKSNMLRGVGAGFSGGVSLETPWTDWLNVSGSADFYPANGLGPIYRKVGAPDKKYSVKNLTGDFLVLGGSGTANLHGMNLCLGLWLTNRVDQCLADAAKCDIRATVTGELLKIVPGGFPLSILANTHAVGVFWGLVNTTDVLSAGVSAFQYRMASAD